MIITIDDGQIDIEFPKVTIPVFTTSHHPEERLGKLLHEKVYRFSITTKCLNNEDVSIKNVCRMVQSEVLALYSNLVDSTLNHSTRDEFKWNEIYDEMQQHTPILLEILLAATTTQCPRPNQEALISMC